MTYILTHSGRQVSVTAGLPSIPDIALSLSRLPRFGGHTRVPYTVLQHSLFVHQLCAQEFPLDYSRQLAALLHDAHESLTGDIPTPFKTEDMRANQRAVDLRLVTALGQRFLFPYLRTPRWYDRRALLAEALIVGPPSLLTDADVYEHFGGRPRADDVLVLKNLLLDTDMEQLQRVFCALVDVLNTDRT